MNINHEDKRMVACVAKFRQNLVITHLLQGVKNAAVGAAYQHVDTLGPGQTAVSGREGQKLVAHLP